LLGTLVGLFWYFFIGGEYFPGVEVVLAFFVSGVAASNAGVAHLKYLPQLTDENSRPLGVSVLTATVGFLGGFTPLLGDCFLKKAMHIMLALMLPLFSSIS
jgi:hypothetical protein